LLQFVLRIAKSAEAAGGYTEYIMSSFSGIVVCPFGEKRQRSAGDNFHEP
jgi:hypothetical protein